MQCLLESVCGGRIAMKNFSKEFYKKITNNLQKNLKKVFEK